MHVHTHLTDAARDAVYTVAVVAVVTLLLLAAAFGGPHLSSKGNGACSGPNDPRYTPTTGVCVEHTATIQEDDPRWNCHTMGNRVCGHKED